MHRSFQKNKFHDHTIRILENRRVGTGGGHIWFPTPPSVLCNDPWPGSSSTSDQTVLAGFVLESKGHFEVVSFGVGTKFLSMKFHLRLRATSFFFSET